MRKGRHIAAARGGARHKDGGARLLVDDGIQPREFLRTELG